MRVRVGCELAESAFAVILCWASVALCRAMNIPARYTFGYLPDIGVISPDTPIDFQARFQAYIGGR